MILSILCGAFGTQFILIGSRSTTLRDCVKTLRNLQSRLDDSSCVNSQVGKGAVVSLKVR